MDQEQKGSLRDKYGHLWRLHGACDLLFMASSSQGHTFASLLCEKSMPLKQATRDGQKNDLPPFPAHVSLVALEPHIPHEKKRDLLNGGHTSHILSRALGIAVQRGLYGYTQS